MVISNHFISFFLSLELLSISLYALIAYLKKKETAIEAGIKYLVLAAVSTAFLLFGVALIYAHTGRLDFNFTNINLSRDPTSGLIFLAGLALIIVGIGFKLGIVPFHLWAPDVYDGAPAVISSFMMTVVKVAGFIAFVRLFQYSFGSMHSQWQMLIVIITAATLLIGNITAVFQQSVKRMLAYSSIAHAGFMMFALFALNSTAKEGLLLYAAAYSLATIGIFAILIKMCGCSGFNPNPTTILTKFFQFIYGRSCYDPATLVAFPLFIRLF